MISVIFLQVLDHGLAAVKLPKNIFNGSSMLLMGFPECGSSYFLLMQLDKDFKPFFKLLETQSGSLGKGESLSDINNVIHVKNVDIGQMLMSEDDLNLSLLDCRKLLAVLPTLASNRTSDEYSLEGSVLSSCSSSNFSSIVDEVFEVEKGSAAQNFPSQVSTFGSSPASHFGSGVLNIPGTKVGTSSPKWDGVTQISQGNNSTRLSNAANGSVYPTNNYKGLIQSGSTGSISSGPGRSQVKRLSSSKSDQDLASLMPSHSGAIGSYSIMDEHQQTTSGTRAARHLSPTLEIGTSVSAPNARTNGPRSSPTRAVSGNMGAVYNSWVQSPQCKIASL